MHRRGLQQGDPLSPMLFIIVMDVLNALIIKTSEEELLQSLSPRVPSHRVSLYANDVVIFLRPTAEELYFIKVLLVMFGNALDLRTNI